MFLIGQRGRDAGFRKDGTLSIWTIGGRKRLSYTIPEYFRPAFESAKSIDSLTVVERDGKLIGRVCVTIEHEEPKSIHPIGIDLNETNALVAVDADERTLFISGKDVKVRNERSFKTLKRLQSKLESVKAHKKDTRSIRRLLKRQGRKRSNRTRTFAQGAAKALCQWAAPDSVLVFEDLSSIPEPTKQRTKGAAIRRRLSAWQRGMIRRYAHDRAQEFSLGEAEVNPAYTSQLHHRCGLLGKRKRHDFYCPACDKHEHADENAAKNIRNRFTVLRGGGRLSIRPEALSKDEGKLSYKANDY